MGTELSPYGQVNDPLAFCEQMGSAIAKSGMLGLPNEEAGKVVALVCFCDKITPIDYLRRYHTISGKPSMRADAMLAEFRMNHGGNHRMVSKTADKAEIVLISKDGTEYEFSITYKEMLEEGTPYKKKSDHSQGLKDNWDSERGRKMMLWARLISDSVRTVCPEVNSGIYTPEEIQDFVDLPQVETAAKTAKRFPDPIIPDDESTKTNETKVVDAEIVKPAVEETQEKPSEKPGKTASTAALMELDMLVQSAKIDADAWVKVLAKRGVTTAENLTPEQCDELTMKLRAKLGN